MTIAFEDFKARLLADPEVRAEYDALAPEFEIATELLRARVRAGLSQAELAARMGTSQSTIARLESGQTLPGTKTRWPFMFRSNHCADSYSMVRWMSMGRSR